MKLTAQTRSLTAEKEDFGGRAAKLSDLLQARDRALVGMTSQLNQLRSGGGGAQGAPPDTQQLTLTYCNPPLVLTTSQVISTLLSFLSAARRHQQLTDLPQMQA